MLRASCVCRMWNQAANNSLLWKTVRMKNSHVNDWSGFVNTLKRNGTKHLDLRKMLNAQNSDEAWQEFSSNIGKVTELESIDLCRTSSNVLEGLFESNPSLRIINALAIKDVEKLHLTNISNLQNLTELRLKSMNTLEVDSLEPLGSATSLKHLSLTSISDLGQKSIHVLGNLTQLESLELGDCCHLTTDLFVVGVLSKLVNLERLRLEKGQKQCCTFDILDEIAKMPGLAQLELVNFDVKPEFDKHLEGCRHLKRLLIIPTYISQSATTNHMILNGVLKLGNLEQLTWVVTLELLRVTELYVDQCDGKRRDRKCPEDKIPVLKPVPGMSKEEQNGQQTIADVPQVEILPLDKVEQILTTHLPHIKFSIIKVPFIATWRQYLIEIQ